MQGRSELITRLGEALAYRGSAMSERLSAIPRSQTETIAIEIAIALVLHFLDGYSQYIVPRRLDFWGGPIIAKPGTHSRYSC